MKILEPKICISRKRFADLTSTNKECSNTGSRKSSFGHIRGALSTVYALD